MRRTLGLCGLLLLIASPIAEGSIVLVKGRETETTRASDSQIIEGFGETYRRPFETVDDRRELQRRVSSRPQLLVALGKDAAEMAKGTGLPMLFVRVPNPAGSGLTGPAIGGVSDDISGATQMKYLKALFPQIRAIGALYNPGSAGPIIEAAKAEAKQLGIVLLPAPAESPREVSNALALISELVQALWVLPDRAFTTAESMQSLMRDTRNRGLPLIVNSEVIVSQKEGAVAGLVPDYRQLGRYCGELATKVETGEAKISDIGTRSPPVALAINRSSARALGITVPQSLEGSTRFY